MKSYKKLLLPTVNDEIIKDENNAEIDIGEKSACPCCGYITIPNNGDALAFICPVCFWEIDTFILGIDEKSDQNHGLTLQEARENFKSFGASMAKLKQYCREPLVNEYK
ncbi:MAG: CPCC family cysteine-rich protein [Oscillospiraceae bacterium]